MSPPHTRGLCLAHAIAFRRGSTGFTTFSNYEQTDFGTTYRVKCPPGVLGVAADQTVNGVPTGIYGWYYYADISYVCVAAAHQALIDNSGGMVLVRVEDGWGPNALNGTVGFDNPLPAFPNNNILSGYLPSSQRTFSVHPYPLSLVEVYTMAGIPAALLDSACGYVDGQPPQDSQVRPCRCGLS